MIDDSMDKEGYKNCSKRISSVGRDMVEEIPAADAEDDARVEVLEEPI